MWYGFDTKQFKSGMKIFMFLGIIAVFLGVVSTFFGSSTGNKNYWALLFLVLCIPSIWLFLSCIFFSTWVKIESDYISWYFFKTWRIKKVAFSELIKVRGGSFSAVVIETSQGNIHIFGLNIPTRVSLYNHLKELNPNIEVG
jgi:hypothetical protein